MMTRTLAALALTAAAPAMKTELGPDLELDQGHV